MKLLNGSELADYIKERQAKQVRNLRQTHQTIPKLAIIQTLDSQVINTYVKMKCQYGEDLLVDVEVHRPSNTELLETIEKSNNDETVHGIIIQMPLDDESQTDEALNAVAPQKDVDGLGANSQHIPATAVAIDWLLNGYNVELKNRRIAIVGNGRLVGSPLAKLWRQAGYDVTVFDEHSKNMEKSLRRFPIIVTAAGVPNLIKAGSIQPGAVVVDAATTAEHGKIVGDVADDVRSRSDITITPEKGGVGPLTVVALFENVLKAARAAANKD